MSKSFSHGFYGSLAYTYTFSQDVTGNPGSQAASVWSANATSGTQNTQELSYSQYAVPHRIVATLSYRVEYLKHLASTFTFFYEGASQGTYSYIYNGDLNQDGNSADLMYIPKDPSEIKFANLAASGTTPAFSAQQQSDAFFQMVSKSHYLSHHMGQTSERNGPRYPFFHRVDFSFLQDLFTNIGKHRNTIQFSVDCTNFLNLLNKDWGLRDFYPTSTPLRASKNPTTGAVVYQLATYTPNGSTTPILVDKTFIRSTSTSSTWAMQFGLRYIF